MCVCRHCTKIVSYKGKLSYTAIIIIYLMVKCSYNNLLISQNIYTTAIIYSLSHFYLFCEFLAHILKQREFKIIKKGKSNHNNIQVGTIENTPDKTQTISEAFTDPVFSNTPVGEMNMPDPMMLPTMTVTPFKRLILGFSSIPSSLSGATSASTADPSSFRFTPIFSLDCSFLTQFLRSTTARSSIYPRF